MKKLVLHTNSREWKWRTLSIRLNGISPFYINFRFEYEDISPSSINSTIYAGYVLVSREVVDDQVKVHICDELHNLIEVIFIYTGQLTSAEKFIQALYIFDVHRSVKR